MSKRNPITFHYMFTITQDQINLIISNISGLISDIMPLLVLLLGIFIGVYIITNLFWKEKDREYDRYFEENEDDYFNY